MVVVFLAEGFEEVEALAPVDVMRRAGLTVKLAGVTGENVWEMVQKQLSI